MKPAEKKASNRGILTRTQAVDDACVSALLAAFAQLEFADQVRELLRAAHAWCGARAAAGFATVDDRRTFAPVEVQPVSDDPEACLAAVGPIQREQSEAWLPRGSTLFEGYGPFKLLGRAWPDGGRPRHTLALPVEGSGRRRVGLILLLLDGAPAPEVERRLAQLLTLARPAVDNGLRVMALRELVIKDDTARCFNRRYFEEFLPEELARANRFRSPLSLIFLDMDNLKQVNNRYGHAIGSRMLCEVAVRVRAKIRKFDKLFRFGGDEFCIVLPETAWHGALEVAERVRDAIGGRPFLTRDLNQGRGIVMSASLGIASYPLHARTRAELIERADRAMQKVKKSGKNAIGIAEIDGDDPTG